MSRKMFTLISVLAVLSMASAACAKAAATEPTQVPASIPTIQPPTPMPAITPTFTPTPVLEKDGMVMVFVPAGEFTMGSDIYNSEKPVHTVSLDSYWIDQTEVTNAMYAKCVEAGACQPPSNTGSRTRSSYYGNPEFDDYPVIYVDWNKARAYCEWAGRRLPTEAEWEKAAGWDDKNQKKHVYPWGDSINCSFANYSGKDNGCVSDTTKVKTYPIGVSSYGAYDMGGNVWEWVSSLHKPYPYDANDGREDLRTSGLQVLRGGGYDGNNDSVRTAFRLGNDPTLTNFDAGFRCSRSQ